MTNNNGGCYFQCVFYEPVSIFNVTLKIDSMHFKTLVHFSWYDTNTQKTLLHNRDMWILKFWVHIRTAASTLSATVIMNYILEPKTSL